MNMSSYKNTSTVADYEYGLEVKARWRPFVEALGLYDEKQDPMTVYLLAGSVIGDQIYSQRLCALLAEEPQGPNGEDVHSGSGDAMVIGPRMLASWTKQERDALRDRVLRHWGRK